MRKVLSWLAEYEKAHGKGEFKATWQREREKKGWWYFLETGRGLESMHIWRIQLGLRETIIKMEKKGNLGNKLGQVISLEQRRLKVKISYTWLSINIKACAISLCFITCLLLLLYFVDAVIKHM